MNNILLFVVSGLLIVLGTLGAVLPFLPGLPLALLGLIIYAWFAKTISVWGVVVFAVLTLFTIIVDIFAPAIAARGKKASKYGVLGALMGGVVGILFLGPIGILLGPFLGAFIGEIMNASDAKHAFQIAIASMFGLVISSAFKLIVGFGMLIYFVLASIK